MMRPILLILLSCLLCTDLSCQSEPALDDHLLVTAEQAFARGDYALAEPLFNQILQEAEATGLPEEKRAATLYHLGELYRLQGQYERAEPFFWQALPVWAKTVGPTHPNMAKGLTSLAFVYESKGEYQKAEPLVKQALKVREKAFGINHPAIVPSLEQYAGLLKLMNRQDEAVALLARGQTILAQHS